MNSTNNTDNAKNDVLALEKQKIYEAALAMEGSYKFPEIDNNAESYFVNYDDAKHLESVLINYDSSEVSYFRSGILKLWHDDELMKKFIPAIHAAYNKSRVEKQQALKSVELYNYMM